MQRIEEYLAQLVGQCPVSHSKRNKIKTEFKDHLLSLVAEFKRKGENEDDSINMAIKVFGNQNIAVDVKKMFPWYVCTWAKVLIGLFLCGAAFVFLAWVITAGVDPWDFQEIVLSSELGMVAIGAFYMALRADDRKELRTMVKWLPVLTLTLERVFVVGIPAVVAHYVGGEPWKNIFHPEVIEFLRVYLPMLIVSIPLMGGLAWIPVAKGWISDEPKEKIA
ncbi:MAG: hypothetical protein AB1500_04715 [Bacillota bacterium]